MFFSFPFIFSLISRFFFFRRKKYDEEHALYARTGSYFTIITYFIFIQCKFKDIVLDLFMNAREQPCQRVGRIRVCKEITALKSIADVIRYIFYENKMMGSPYVRPYVRTYVGFKSNHKEDLRAYA